MATLGRMFSSYRPEPNQFYTPAPAYTFFKTYKITDTVLGTGMFSTVKVATDRKKAKYAVKIIDKTDLSDRQIRNLFKEVAIFKAISHKHVVQFYECYESQKHIFILMECAFGGELFRNAGEDLNVLDENDSKIIVKTIAYTLNEIMHMGIIHRDLKPENILLSHTDGNARLLIADFGFAVQVEPGVQGFNLLQTVCGSPRYIAPEIMGGDPYNYKCDIWSLGVLTYLLLSGGNLPFKGSNNRKDLFKKLKNGDWDFTPEDAWKNVSDEAKDFISHLLVVDPEERYDYDQILEHEWLVSVDISKTMVTPNMLKLRELNEKRDQSKKPKGFRNKMKHIAGTLNRSANSDLSSGSSGDDI
eukprot:CAMPEP_0204875334 /NCGR_PEP_ID=MMETSP1348-20121228/45634_1 /ASSEMBLY_ACC=CAM_ASM_000700 /TAXON_ID=215587 /ORGANISM="Aplanochytrium stocchinoi, Strain GSBS06" /LENGTH=357 /DNA_ID=CAMNT_0052031705 /DNA_START=98 /DNA_END=1174 /DNA_ORIENTATION=-